MKTQMIRAMGVMVATAMLAGCGEHAARPSAQAELTPGAPATAAPVVVALAAPPAAPAPAAAPTLAPVVAEPARPAPQHVSLGADDKLSVKRFVIARSVKDHEPVGTGATFSGSAHKVYAFVEVENRGGAPAEIVVEFEPPGGGAPHGDVTLAVGPAPRWRTWAYTRTASTAGSWTAVVKNKKGDVLARAPFEVTL